MNLAGPLEDLDVLFVGDEGFISVAGFFGGVGEIHADDALKEDVAWAFLGDRDKRIVMGICLRSSVRPLAQPARDTYDKIDELARATLALRYLDGAMKHEMKVQARIEQEVERLRGELEQNRNVWAKVMGIVDVLIGDRA